MPYPLISDAMAVNMARNGDSLAWLECLARGIECRVMGAR